MALTPFQLVNPLTLFRTVLGLAGPFVDNPESARLHYAPEIYASRNQTEVLPVVMIRHPYTWINAMCLHSYRFVSLFGVFGNDLLLFFLAVHRIDQLCLT